MKNTQITYTTKYGETVWALSGSKGRYATHLTVESAAQMFEFDCTDRFPNLDFESLCGVLVTQTCVAPHITNTDAVCKACARKAIQITN